jgi:hypothetical protein
VTRDWSQSLSWAASNTQATETFANLSTTGAGPTGSFPEPTGDNVKTIGISAGEDGTQRARPMTIAPCHRHSSRGHPAQLLSDWATAPTPTVTDAKGGASADEFIGSLDNEGETPGTTKWSRCRADRHRRRGDPTLPPTWLAPAPA